MSKKQSVKEVILKMEGVITRENALRSVTNRGWGARWGEPLVDCSQGTVTRALEELVQEGKLEKYMKYGHCYDYWRYRKPKDQSID